MKPFALKIFVLLAIVTESFAQNPQRLRQQYLTALKRLEFAKDVEISYPNVEARRQLQQSETHLEEARILGSRRRILIAERKINRANTMITSALSMILDEPIRMKHKRLNDLILKIDPLVFASNNQKAKQMLTEAKDYERKAKDSYKEQNFQLALEQLRLGLFLAHNTQNLIDNQNVNIQEKVAEEKQRILQLKLKAENAVASSQNSTAKKLLRLAEKQLIKTQESLSEQNYSQAIEHYHQATRLLLRVIDLAQTNHDKIGTNINEEMVALDELIDNIQTRIQKENIHLDDRLSFLLDRIIEYQQNANNALEEKNYNIARFSLQMARNLVERTLQLIDQQDDNRKVQNKTAGDADQLNLRLEELASIINESQNDEAKVLFDLALKAKERAKFLSDRKRNQLANGSLRTAYRLADVAEQMVNDPASIRIDKRTVEQKLTKMKLLLTGLKEKQLQLTPLNKLLLTEAERVYDVSANAFDQGFYVVTREGLHIAEKYVSLISK